jgi:hypothetical protein
MCILMVLLTCVYHDARFRECNVASAFRLYLSGKLRLVLLLGVESCHHMHGKIGDCRVRRNV